MSNLGVTLRDTGCFCGARSTHVKSAGPAPSSSGSVAGMSRSDAPSNASIAAAAVAEPPATERRTVLRTICISRIAYSCMACTAVQLQHHGEPAPAHDRCRRTDAGEHKLTVRLDAVRFKGGFDAHYNRNHLTQTAARAIAITYGRACAHLPPPALPLPLPNLLLLELCPQPQR